MWVYLNWALGLRSLGVRVVWLAIPRHVTSTEELREKAKTLKSRLSPYHFSDSLVLCSAVGKPISGVGESFDPNPAFECDMLLNMRYDTSSEVIGHFRRTTLPDIDPGLLQYWITEQEVKVATHDFYFSIGENVNKNAAIPNVGIRWQYTKPCVDLSSWPKEDADDESPFSTVSHWYAEKHWIRGQDGLYRNDKRSGFLPLIDLPRHTSVPLELALRFGEDDEEMERARLHAHGWRTRNSVEVASSTTQYQHYIQNSRGEFSCCKPSCVRFQNAWVSDRTLCYLASGKPVVVQHTGPSRFLPEDAGMHRFRDRSEAVLALDRVTADYARQCALARELAEEHFDARLVCGKLLERCL